MQTPEITYQTVKYEQFSVLKAHRFYKVKHINLYKHQKTIKAPCSRLAADSNGTFPPVANMWWKILFRKHHCELSLGKVEFLLN